MKICIQPQQDGTFSVYDEDANPQNNEGDVIGGETPAQTAKTVDDALAIAKQMLSGGAEGGMTPEKMLEEPMPACDAMQAGFKKARGPAYGG